MIISSTDISLPLEQETDFILGAFLFAAGGDSLPSGDGVRKFRLPVFFGVVRGEFAGFDAFREMVVRFGGGCTTQSYAGSSLYKSHWSWEHS